MRLGGFGIKRGTIAALIAAVLLIVGAGIAAAHRASYATTVIQEGTSPSPRPDFKVTGHLESPKGACIRDRTVKFLGRTEDGTAVLLAKDRTNDRGRWKVIGDTTTTHDERIQATEKRLPKRHRHHRRVCLASTIAIVH
jgi:hypothetical protein